MFFCSMKTSETELGVINMHNLSLQPSKSMVNIQSTYNYNHIPIVQSSPYSINFMGQTNR